MCDIKQVVETMYQVIEYKGGECADIVSQINSYPREIVLEMFVTAFTCRPNQVEDLNSLLSKTAFSELTNESVIKQMYSQYQVESQKTDALGVKMIQIIRSDDVNSLREALSRPEFKADEEKIETKHEGHNCTYNLIEYAAFCGSILSFKFLLLNGYNTPDIAYAIMGGNEEIIRTIEESNSRIDSRVLREAVSYQRNEVTRWLCETKGVAKSAYSIHDAARYNNIMFLEYTKSVADKSRLVIALQENKQIAFRYLIEQIKVDPNEGAPLNFLTEKQNQDTFCYLLDHGADINYSDGSDTPLTLSIRKNLPDMFKYLIDKGADVNANGGNEYPIHAAVYYNHPNMLETLFSKNVNCNCKNKNGLNPADLAVSCSSFELLEVFKKRKVVPSDYILGKPTLLTAVERLDIRLVRILLEIGINPNATDEHKWSPLIEAVLKNRLDMVTLLVSKGADVNAATEKGRTPLHWAKGSHFDDIAEFLIKKGAKSRQDIDGLTPEDFETKYKRRIFVDTYQPDSPTIDSEGGSKKKCLVQ